jgi:hypothetical protein
MLFWVYFDWFISLFHEVVEWMFSHKIFGYDCKNENLHMYISIKMRPST